MRLHLTVELDEDSEGLEAWELTNADVTITYGLKPRGCRSIEGTVDGVEIFSDDEGDEEDC
jgi:hypothetical protein